MPKTSTQQAIIDKKLLEGKETIGDMKCCTYCKFARRMDGNRICIWKKGKHAENPCSTALNRMYTVNTENRKDEAAAAKGLYTKQQMKDLLRTNLAAVRRAIVVLYERQQPDEQRKGITFTVDNKGFSRNDIEHFARVYDLVKAGKALSDKDLAISRNMLYKYSQQLADISNRNKREAECKQVSTGS